MTQPIRVLVVDDDDDVVWGLGCCLTRNGYQVVTCGDGAEAISELERRPFDALVTDVQMANTNGIAVVEWAQSHRPGMRIVVITAYGSPSLREVAQRLGVNLYLEKPIDPDLILRVLSAPVPRDSFSGMVDQIDLFDYVQLIVLSRRQAILQVVSTAGETGMLYVDRGEVTHAQCGDIVGEQAFFRCLSFDGGSFTSLPWSPPEEVSIQRRADHLLMDAARIKDERKKAQKKSPVSAFPPDSFDADLDRALTNVMDADAGTRTRSQ